MWLGELIVFARTSWHYMKTIALSLFCALDCQGVKIDHLPISKISSALDAVVVLVKGVLSFPFNH
ncbi:MAG: hypothetical protein IPP57_28455 [Candidatus Obscuribacter sp.]|nr:hypothetical protein [Candidatus Obscuribacter sp.]MBK9774711.1 hypothetical protein [Candidatus Obscuribacter sp.]